MKTDLETVSDFLTDLKSRLETSATCEACLGEMLVTTVDAGFPLFRPVASKEELQSLSKMARIVVVVLQGFMNPYDRKLSPIASAVLKEMRRCLEEGRKERVGP